MTVGWECPKCNLILAPQVTEHRCKPPDDGVPAVVTPYQPTSGSGGSTTWPGTITVTPGYTYWTSTVESGGSGGISTVTDQRTDFGFQLLTPR
jgi:hypothetical protein